MHETYRMLGREHEADLEREAVSRRLAAEVANGPRHDVEAPQDQRWLNKKAAVVGIIAVVTIAIVAAGFASVAAGADVGSSGNQLERGALTQARQILAEVEARYQRAPGRKLVVTEASTTSVIESFTLLSANLQEVVLDRLSRPRVFVPLGLEPTPSGRDSLAAMPRWPIANGPS